MRRRINTSRFSQDEERQDYLAGWGCFAERGLRTEAEVSASWFVGKRKLEEEVARCLGEDAAVSWGALDKRGWYSSFLQKPLGELASKEAAAARILLRGFDHTMDSETYGIILAFLVSCHAAARA